MLSRLELERCRGEEPADIVEAGVQEENDLLPVGALLGVERSGR